jgi:hypothetical protein
MSFPHVAVYGTFAGTYIQERFLAWAAATKEPNEDVSPNCIPYTTLGPLSTFAASTHTTRITKLLCSLPRSPVIAVDALGPRRFRLKIVLPPNKLEVESLIATRASTLTYASRYCRRGTIPAS